MLWGANVVSNTGTWMQGMTSGWLMTELDPSPLMVGLVQVMTSLPAFLFSIPAGAIADMVDRRHLMMGVVTAMGLVAGILGLVVLTGAITPTILLSMTFFVGIGTSLLMPTWYAIVPHLVPPHVLPEAIALNSIGMNISRALGPAAAGLLVAAVGMWSPYLVNAASFAGVAVALWLWQTPEKMRRRSHRAGLIEEMLIGLRHVRRNRPLMTILIRATSVIFFAGAYWSLMPLIGRVQVGGGPEFYGFMVGSQGAGAVIGATLLPRLRGWLGADRLTKLGGAGTIVVLLIFGITHSKPLAIVASLSAGATWIAVMSTLNVSAQQALADWVRGRGMALFSMVVFGSIAGGSLVWGALAQIFDTPTALFAAAAGLSVSMLAERKSRIGEF